MEGASIGGTGNGKADAVAYRFGSNSIVFFASDDGYLKMSEVTAEGVYVKQSYKSYPCGSGTIENCVSTYSEASEYWTGTGSTTIGTYMPIVSGLPDFTECSDGITFIRTTRRVPFTLNVVAKMSNFL